MWNTEEILSAPEQQAELIGFARKAGINNLFLQLPNAPSNLGSKGDIRLEQRLWKPFLEALHAAAIRAYALDGFKNYALAAWHERVLLTVDNIVRYNASVEPHHRFCGMHYDIEPYLLDGYQGPRRSRILQGYFQLLEGMAAKARASGLVFGVDIPFWYDAPDAFTGADFRLEFRGAVKPPSQHVIDLVDQIGIMDYRTSSYGADGVIAHAKDELTYAGEKGKRIFIGVETIELPDEELLDFGGGPSFGLPEAQPAGRAVVLVPGKETAALYIISGTQWHVLRSRLAAAGWNPQSVLWWPVKKSTPVPSQKITFARQGLNRLHTVMSEAEEEFRTFGAFAGFAIHDYLGYRRLFAASRE